MKQKLKHINITISRLSGIIMGNPGIIYTDLGKHVNCTQKGPGQKNPEPPCCDTAVLTNAPLCLLLWVIFKINILLSLCGGFFFHPFKPPVGLLQVLFIDCICSEAYYCVNMLLDSVLGSLVSAG